MSDTQLKVVTFQPGFNKNTTPYSAENYWIDGDKVRFKNGKAEKIGGWVSEVVEQATDNTNNLFTGVARDIHSWVDLSFNKYIAVATNAKIELFFGGQIYDITPYREELTLTDAITTASGSSIVTIDDTNHNLSVGDYVFVDSQASAVDGVTLSGEYQVLTVVDGDSYTIDSGTTASGTTAGSGGNLEINYLLEVGDTDNGNLLGYGGDTFGTPGSATITTVNLTDAIDTSSGDATVTINDTAHGLSVGDGITVVSQASTVDGIDLSGNDFTGDFEVTTVPNANSYTIEAVNNETLVEVLASGTTSGGGGALVLQYGGEGWDRPRAGVGGSFLRQWTFDNWGEDLLACERNGKVYQWDASSGVTTRMQEISNAPSQSYMVLVAQPSRYLVAFGSEQESGSVFDPLTVRWASQESLTNWTASGSTSGEYRLPLGNYIVNVVQTKGEILIFTDNTVYSMRHVGGTSIFSFDIIATNVTAVSQHCSVDIDGIVFWMGLDSFYMYNGVVQTIKSSLEDFIFDQDGGGKLNFEQKEKVYCATNKEFNEVIWLYPSNDNLEVDRYIIYNFVENVWYDGTLDRTVWLDKSIFEKPYALTSTGTLYVHESGKDDDGSAITAFIKSGDLDLGEGQSFVFVDKFIPDFNLIPNRNAQLTLYLKKYPSSTATTKGPYVFNNNTDKISLRARARHMAIQYEVDSIGADFEVGSPRFSFQVDGSQ